MKALKDPLDYSYCVGLDRFELLELRRDDGVQTYHAREVATARPVQVHLFANGRMEDALKLFYKVTKKFLIVS